MASYRGHLTFSTGLGVAYGGAAFWYLGYDWGTAVLGGGLTAIGGLLPDLDSDSGVPVRELFGLAAVLAPFLLMSRIAAEGFNSEQTLVILGGLVTASLLDLYVLPALFFGLRVSAVQELDFSVTGAREGLRGKLPVAHGFAAGD